VRALVDRLDRLAALDVTSRLAAIVRESHRARRGAAFTLGQTHQGLAEELGTVREVVVRSLRELRRRGIITSAGRGRYRVADARALDMAAGA
jgi:CRP-like cAMP-binding protein